MRKALRQKVAASLRSINELTDMLSEARMLESLSQQLDSPEQFLQRSQTVAGLQAALASEHLTYAALREEHEAKFGNGLDFLGNFHERQKPAEQKPADDIAALQAEFLTIARKLAALDASLPDELELFYSIKHVRGRYGDVISWTPHLTLAQAQGKFADRTSHPSLDHRGKYDFCEKFAVVTSVPDREKLAYNRLYERDLDLTSKHAAVYIPD